MKKPWYKSKTVWFNVLTIGGAVLSGVAGLLPTLQLLIPPEVYAITLFTIGVGNIVLRTLTTGPINWSEEEDAGSD